MSHRVFVTGAFGYVGRTLVHHLTSRGHTVRALSRRPQASGIPGVEPVVGDLTRGPLPSALLEGCRWVVHGAPTSAAETTSFVTACLAAGVDRFVHLSTTSVYRLDDGVRLVTEESPEVGPEDDYGRRKADSARAALASGGETVCVLEPACVYGGHGGWWSGALLDLMRRGVVLLPAHGQGLANLVHVADLADATLLALEADASVAGGRRFIVTDGRPITWARYYGWLEAVVGRPAVEAVSTPECRRRSAEAMQGGVRHALRGLRRRLAGRPPVFPLNEAAIVRAAATVTFCPDRVRAALGFAATRQPERDWRTAPGQPDVIA